MKKLKYLIGQIHLYLGLISAIVVFIVCLSGCLYVFEEEIRNIFQKKYYYVNPHKYNRKNLYQISNAVKQKFPNEKIIFFGFKSKPNSAFIYFTSSKKAISINPYTLEIIGIRNLKTDFFSFILQLHLNLKLGKIGKEIIKWNVLIFLILVISGIIIWFPKNIKYIKQAIIIPLRFKNLKRLNWSLHTVLGFYSSFILLIISLTGMFWAFDSCKTFIGFVTKNNITNYKAPENKSKKETNFLPEDAYYIAKQNYSDSEIQTFISCPVTEKQPIRITFRYKYTWVRKQNVIYFDKNSGEILKKADFKNYNTYDKIAMSNYDFHTGSFKILGISSKIIYFLVSLFATSLPITGFIIWYNKLFKKNNKKKSNL